MVDAINPDLPFQSRVRALESLALEIEAGEREAAAIREPLKTLAWSRRLGQSIRVAAFRTLLADRSDDGSKDNEQLVALMLPTERDPLMIALLCEATAERDWTQATPALVRSYARVFDGIDDADRAEADALIRMHPDRPLAEVVFGVFVEPGADSDAFRGELRSKTRRAAWNLLGRLDADGSIRVGLLVDVLQSGSDALDDPGLASLAAGLNELRVIPLTGEELEWLQALHADRLDGGSARSWWSDSARAISALDASQRARLRLRNVEPIRWASRHEPGWLTLDRDQLLEELGRRLSRTTQHDRQVSRRSEQLAGWRDASWSELLTVLVLDEAIRQPRVADSLLVQAEEDRLDMTTEYGGLLEADPRRDPKTGLGFRAVLYKPRPVMREGDRIFVASREMIRDGARALAHYHLHAQKVRNSAYAGPSEGDLGYAARYGRVCVVFTSIRPGVLNADCYTPEGRILDLGEISLDTPPAAQGG